MRTKLPSYCILYYLCQKLRGCLKKLAIVEDTLEKLGIMTNYQKLYTRVLLIIFAWFTLLIFKTYTNSLLLTDYCKPMKAFYISFIVDYCPHINLIDDLTIASILRLVYESYFTFKSSNKSYLKNYKLYTHM